MNGPGDFIYYFIFVYVCDYVRVVYVHLCVQLYAHRYQRRMSGVLL